MEIQEELKIITPRDLNAYMKKEISLVKVSKSRGHFQNPKPIKDWNNKFMMGVKGAGIGPMTMTSQHNNFDREISDNVNKKLRRLDGIISVDNNVFTFRIGKNKIRKLTFNWSYFPSNVPSANLDSGYQTNWFVMSQEDSTVKKQKK